MSRSSGTGLAGAGALLVAFSLLLPWYVLWLPNIVDTTQWYERQTALCLLGALVIFGWEKAFGSDAELRWWCQRAVQGAGWL